MKEFEKWFEKQKASVVYVPQEWANGAEAGWKAALEWILSNLDGKTDILELALRIREEQDYV